MANSRKGYSDVHVDEVLRREREQKRMPDREWAIDLSRPTNIKVNRKYLSPATLDFYSLPWEWYQVRSTIIFRARSKLTQTAGR